MQKKKRDGISFGAFRELIKAMAENAAKAKPSVGNTGAVRRKVQIGTKSLCRVVGFIPLLKGKKP